MSRVSISEIKLLRLVSRGDGREGDGKMYRQIGNLRPDDHKRMAKSFRCECVN